LVVLCMGALIAFVGREEFWKKNKKN